MQTLSGDVACLVGLHLSDEVPGETESGKRLELPERLLHVALAEMEDSRAGRFLDHIGRPGLACGH
jgi:hypothetical protein